jgi:hypothetical protein
MALINGINWGAGNVRVILPVIGFYPGITEINYERKQDKKNHHGLGVEPIGRGYGIAEYTGDISMYEETWALIALGSPDKDPIKLPPFPITIVIGGLNVPFKKIVLASAEFMNNPFSAKSGDTKLVKRVQLVIGGIE